MTHFSVEKYLEQPDFSQRKIIGRGGEGMKGGRGVKGGGGREGEGGVWEGKEGGGEVIQNY